MINLNFNKISKNYKIKIKILKKNDRIVYLKLKN